MAGQVFEAGGIRENVFQTAGSIGGQAIGEAMGSAGGPIGAMLGGFIGGGIFRTLRGLFGHKKKNIGEVPSSPVYVKDVAMTDMLSQLLNVTKAMLAGRAGGGIDRVSDLRLAQQSVGVK
jgi:hypothetical protein